MSVFVHAYIKNGVYSLPSFLSLSLSFVLGRTNYTAKKAKMEKKYAVTNTVGFSPCFSLFIYSHKHTLTFWGWIKCDNKSTGSRYYTLAHSLIHTFTKSTPFHSQRTHTHTHPYMYILCMRYSIARHSVQSAMYG